MNEVFTIVATVITALAALAGVWLSDVMARKRERATHDLQMRREKVRRLEDLFARVLYIIERGAQSRCLHTAEESAEIDDVRTRLSLLAPPEIVLQFQSAAVALEKWAEESRLSTASGDPADVARAERLYPTFLDHRARLIILMRDLLDSGVEDKTSKAK